MEIYCNKPLDNWLPKLINNGLWSYSDEKLLLIYIETNKHVNNLKEIDNFDNSLINKNEVNYLCNYDLNSIKDRYFKLKKEIPFYYIGNLRFEKYLNYSIYDFLLTGNEIHFIHIGKCGGTTINSFLRISETHHRKPPLIKLLKYIIWLRNPIARFVSSFWFIQVRAYSYYIKYICGDKNNEFIKSFEKSYDVKVSKKDLEIHLELIKRFDNPTDFAKKIFEILNNKNDKLNSLLNPNRYSLANHLAQSIGFYLDNGKFIENNYNNIFFVGTVENINEDFKKLLNKLNTNTNFSQLINKRNNQDYIFYDKYLSKKAIENIKEFYKGDYEALKMLKDYKFISENYYNSCFHYKYIKDE